MISSLEANLIMNKIFESAFIAGIVIKNRILRSATHEGMSDDAGYPTAELYDLYERLASNNVGAIITGFVAIQPSGRMLKNTCMLDNDKYIDVYKEKNMKLSKYQVPIILQLAHGGGQCFVQVTGEKTVAPSSLRYMGYPRPKELSEKEIESIINDFGEAIVRAKKAEFAGV